MRKKIILKNILNEAETYPERTIAEVQTEFENNLKDRGLRAVTIKFYDHILDAFYKFISYQEPICNIRLNTVTNFMNYCREVRNNSENTISTNIRGLRTFLYFAMRNDYMPKFKIQVPAPDLTPKTTYKIEEVQKLLIKPDLQHCNLSEYIAYIGINIFVFTGCRLSTAVNVKIEDIDFENNLIIFKHTKNKRPHCVPLAEELKEVLLKYIDTLNKQNIKTEYLLISCYGEPITTTKLYRYIYAYNKKRGVNITSIHAFRRFYIKSLVIQGVPIPKIQFLVQHKNPELITLYTKLYAKDLVYDVEQFQDNIINKSNKRRYISLKK